MEMTAARPQVSSILVLDIGCPLSSPTRAPTRFSGFSIAGSTRIGGFVVCAVLTEPSTTRPLVGQMTY
jgi:hypothetical protein